MKLYHYSSTKFDAIDMSKCDGFWMTTIAPHEVDMLDEIGASGSSFVAVCELDADNLVAADDSVNFDVEDFMNEQNADFMICKYDGFTDYCVVDASKVAILEWKKM